MATNKSKSLKALSAHMATYTAVLLFFGAGFCWFTGVGYLLMVQYILINAALHMATDFITSKGSSRAFAAKRIDLFWTIVGFDQFIHTATFILTLSYFIV
jgi:hypothetical protein